MVYICLFDEGKVRAAREMKSIQMRRAAHLILSDSMNRDGRSGRDERRAVLPAGLVMDLKHPTKFVQGHFEKTDTLIFNVSEFVHGHKTRSSVFCLENRGNTSCLRCRNVRDGARPPEAVFQGLMTVRRQKPPDGL